MARIMRPIDSGWLSTGTGTLSNVPGRAGGSDGVTTSRVGCQWEAPPVLVDWNRASGSFPVGGKWAPARDIARFESVGSCLPDRDSLRQVLCDKQAAVRSEWHEKQQCLVAVRSSGRVAELPDGGDRVNGQAARQVLPLPNTRIVPAGSEISAADA